MECSWAQLALLNGYEESLGLQRFTGSLTLANSQFWTKKVMALGRINAKLFTGELIVLGENCEAFDSMIFAPAPNALKNSGSLWSYATSIMYRRRDEEGECLFSSFYYSYINNSQSDIKKAHNQTRLIVSECFLFSLGKTLTRIY